MVTISFSFKTLEHANFKSYLSIQLQSLHLFGQFGRHGAHVTNQAVPKYVNGIASTMLIVQKSLTVHLSMEQRLPTQPTLSCGKSNNAKHGNAQVRCKCLCGLVSVLPELTSSSATKYPYVFYEFKGGH